MLIYINSRFLTQPVTGAQRYGIELSLRLKQLDPSIEFVCPKNVIQHDIFEQLNAKTVGKRIGHLWEQIDLPLYLKKQGNPLLLNLCNTAPIFYKNKITAVHDIIHALYPQSCSFAFRLWYKILIPRILKSSLTIITVSEFSKKEISNYYKYQSENIHVVYNAVNKQFKNRMEIDKVSKPYLLAVSSINYHKNYARMIEAFINLYKSKNLNISLFIIGGTALCYSKQHYDLVQDMPIRFLGRVSDNELINLYQNAEAFVFPSLYEGFGIPPLEAQSCGCPVISSNTASMPEVLEDSAIYFNPTDVNEIQHAMDVIIGNKQLQNLLINKGFLNVDRFSWDESANKLYNIISGILSKTKS
jgi:glycosyltransferase involved in cell wall biosynthesis